MGLEITVQNDYILVEPPKGINYWEILEGIGRLMHTDGYRNKNVIWEFRDGPVMLLYDDLYKITNIIKEHYLKNPKRDKTAILAETGLQLSMADEFAKIATDLPCDIKVFSNKRSAEEWILD